jgi:hypothetical protein
MGGSNRQFPRSEASVEVRTMSLVMHGALMVLFLCAWWRRTWHGSPKGTLMLWILLILAAAIVTLHLEISRLTAAAL